MFSKNLLVPLAIAGGLLAQEPLTLPDAARLALQQNQSIAAADAGARSADARILAAKSGFLPKVNFSESWTRSDNPVFVFSSLLTQHQFTAANFALDPLNRPDFTNNFQSQLSADQPLYDAGKTARGIRLAMLGKDAAAEDVRRAKMDSVAGVARAYYSAQLFAAQWKVTELAQRSAEADLERAQARLAAGMATEVDVLSVKVHLAAIQEQQIRIGANLEVAQAALNDAIGLPLETPHRLTTALTVLAAPGAELAAVEESAASQRPEQRQAKIGKDAAELSMAEARSNLLPQVAMHAGFEAERQRFYDRGGANWLVAIGVRWNLFNGNADKARIEESRAAASKAAAEQKRAESAVRLEVRRAYADWKAAEHRIVSASATVTEAEESLRITQNRYGAGLSTISDVLRAEAALLDTRTRHLAAIHDQRLAAAMLELAAGNLNPDSEVLR